jgi:hypothetical protein
MVELEAENVVGSYSHPEHEACLKCLQNGGRLNRVFELAGVAYGPRPEPGTEAQVEASKKRKVDAYGKTVGKHAKIQAKKKTELFKVVVLRAKSDVKWPSSAKVATAKHVKRTKKIVLDSPTTPVVG